MLLTTPEFPTSVQGLSHQEQAMLDELLHTWQAKLPRNSLRSAYYDGRRAARDLGGNLTPPHLRNLALVLGWSAKAVDQLNRRCKLETFTGSQSALAAEIFDANWLGSEAGQANVSSLIHSVAFLITTRGEPGTDEPDILITSRSAMDGAGLWDARSRQLKAFVSINALSDNNEPTEMTFYPPNLIITISRRFGQGFVVTDRKPHPYGTLVTPLVYKPRLNRPFGSSRISRPVMSIHNAALRTILRNEVTDELFQVPQRVLLGSDETAFQNTDGSPKPMWQSVLGLIWAIPDDLDSTTPRADIKQLPGASPEPYLAKLRMQAQLFAGETSIPISSLGIGGDSNPTSADAYIASREDLIAEAEGTVDGWSPAWKRAMLTGMQMLEDTDTIPAEWLDLTPQWRSPVFVSRAAAADAGQKQLATIPWLAETEVGLELLGLSPDQIKRALAERRRAEGRLARRQVQVPAQAPEQLPPVDPTKGLATNDPVNG